MPPKTNAFAANLAQAQRALMRWYKAHGRHGLPWRTTKDPYHVYVSEVMLQQTQVATVLARFYHPFLKRFPTLAALAEAPREDVVKAWEGLGYYTRARNLHAAAQACKGRLPTTPEELLALPGIGQNTAHAVACFGFGARVPILEANVKRVVARVFALQDADEKLLWQRAGELFDAKNAFDYNQAMMDIGARVCTKRNPRCGECPLNSICKGKTNPEAYPAPKGAKVTPVRKKVIVAFRDAAGRYHLTPRDTNFLGGLYGFAEFDEAQEVTFKGKRHHLTRENLLGQIVQVYSHFRLEARVYVVNLAGKGNGTMVALSQMRALPLSKADHKVAALLAAREASAA